MFCQKNKWRNTRAKLFFFFSHAERPLANPFFPKHVTSEQKNWGNRRSHKTISIKAPFSSRDMWCPSSPPSSPPSFWPRQSSRGWKDPLSFFILHFCGGNTLFQPFFSFPAISLRPGAQFLGRYTGYKDTCCGMGWDGIPNPRKK